jgi:maltose alpha-D-glucosyltransferase/alpha-amylase
MSPLKDVAGMLRSFDYAMHAALVGVAHERPDAAEALGELARRWRNAVQHAFVDAYDETAAANGMATARGDGAALLRLFMLEKLVYELAYELDNRPDWSTLPLAGLAELLAPA